MMSAAVGCTKSQMVRTESVCRISFDYGDEGVNDQNARALLIHYCLCKDEKQCL